MLPDNHLSVFFGRGDSSLRFKDFTLTSLKTNNFNLPHPQAMPRNKPNDLNAGVPDTKVQNIPQRAGYVPPGPGGPRGRNVKAASSAAAAAQHSKSMNSMNSTNSTGTGPSGNTKNYGSSGPNSMSNSAHDDDDEDEDDEEEEDMVPFFTSHAEDHESMENSHDSQSARSQQSQQSQRSQQSQASMQSRQSLGSQASGTAVSMTDRTGISQTDQTNTYAGTSSISGSRASHIKHFFGNAILYGQTEATAKIYILLKNIYTKKHGNATHRIIGRLEYDTDVGRRGIVWENVPRSETRAQTEELQESLMRSRMNSLNNSSAEEESDMGGKNQMAIVAADSKKDGKDTKDGKDGTTKDGKDGKKSANAPTKYFRKRPDLKIPVLLAHLAAEKQFRTTFEAQVKAIHPVQYKAPKKKHWKVGGMGGAGLMSDNEGSSEFCK